MNWFYVCLFVFTSPTNFVTFLDHGPWDIQNSAVVSKNTSYILIELSEVLGRWKLFFFNNWSMDVKLMFQSAII